MTGMKWLDGMNDSMDVSLSELRNLMRDGEDWHATIHRVKVSDMTEGLN